MNPLNTVVNLAGDILASHPKAIYRLVVNDIDISSLVNNRLISLEIDDKRGMESDSLSIELSDHDGLLDIPPLNAEIQVWLGWESTGLVYKGKYKATEVDHAGAPDRLSIRATSADLKKTLKQKKERSFDNKSIADIITAIAYEHELTPYVHPDLADNILAHIDQNESDANLITRIADEHNAIATIKNGSLLFMPKGKSETASGLELPTAIIVRASGDNHRYSKTNGGDDISGVTCYYYDAKKAERQSVTVGDNTQNIKELRHFCRDQEAAFHAAQAEYNRIKSKAAVFTIDLARGIPDLIPEMEIETQGFKPEIDEIFWLCTTVKHKLDDSGGFSTSLEAEVKMPNSDDIAQLVEDEQGGDFTGVVAYYKNGNATPKVTLGDQKSPKRLTYLYKNKKTAQNGAKREWDAIQAEKKASQQSNSS